MGSPGAATPGSFMGGRPPNWGKKKKKNHVVFLVIFIQLQLGHIFYHQIKE
jgi:hypothetical protein